MSPRLSVLFQAPNVHIQSPSADGQPISASSAVPKLKNREINDNSMCRARTVLAYIWLSEFQTSVTVFKYIPRYVAIREAPCQFSNARLIPVYCAVRTSRVTLASTFTHRLRNHLNGLTSGTKMCLSAVIFNT